MGWLLLHLNRPEVIYFDTFGSINDPIVTVRSGACGSSGGVEACSDDTCGGLMAQGAVSLPTGDHCFIVDQANETSGTASIHFLRGVHSGDALPAMSGSVSGNTCNDQNRNDAECGCEPAMDHHYFFTVCPNQTINAHIETCTLANWDTVLQIRKADGTSLACEDDTCNAQTEIAADATGPGLFWAIVDGCDECGEYELAYELN